jgi:hypothetical protein
METLKMPTDGPEIVLTPEEEAELEESFGEIDRGEYVDGDEFLRELKRRSRA